MKRIVSMLSFLAMLPALGQAASAYPYPQNVTYAHGSRPAAVTGSQLNDTNTIMGKYTAWRGNHLVSAGGGQLRIQRDGANGNDTVSEGISYGMILAVYFDDKATFDGLWAYKQAHCDGQGLMNWRLNSGGGVTGSNSATDADEDIAYSLYLAYYQWGTAQYKTWADAEVLKLKSYDIDGAFHVKPGDNFNSCRYPSYFFPNEYRVFAKQTNDAYTWDQVRTGIYSTIAVARDNGTGLLAESCTDTGQGGSCGVSTSQYQYNSCRVPFRMALDFCYYNDPGALTELTKLNNYWPTVAPGGPANIYDCQNLTGGQCGGFNTSAFQGPAATGYMASGANLQSYYAFLMGRDESANYYAGALQLLSLLLLSGNMPNIADPSAIYSPTPTMTRTPFAGTPTPTFTATPIAFGYIFEDFELGTLKAYYPYAGASSGVTGTVSNLVTNGGSAYSNKVVVNIAASQYGGYGFDSNYANGLGILDMTGTTVVRFWINTPNTVSMNVSIHEGNAVGGGDNQQWKSPNITVFGMPGWQQITSPIFSLWTKDTTCGSGCNIAGNATLDLGSVKTVQMSFNAPQAQTTLYIDDVAFIPAVAPSPTFTKTPFNNPYNQIYDDFESPMSLSVSAGRAGTFADSANGASASWSLDTTTVASGATSGKLTYNTGNASSYGAGGFLISPYGTVATYVDASGAVSLALWMYSATPNLKYQLEFTEAGTTTTAVAGADGEAWLSPLQTYPGGGWQWVVVDLGDFSEDIYNPSCTPNCLTKGNGIKDFQAISSVTIKINPNQGAGSMYIDDVNFITTYKTPTPTISPSPSQSFTRTPTSATTPTTTTTSSPSQTPTASLTASGTPTQSRTMTSSPSASATRSATASPSPSASASASPSVTPYYSPSATITDTPYAGSPTNTPTVSPSSTNSPFYSNTPSFTATGTPSNSATASPSRTPSASPSASGTATQSVTASATKTQTQTVTGTFSPSPSGTATPMITDSGMTWVPSSLTVTVGTTVTWGWAGFHGVVSDTASEPYTSAVGSPGSFSHTFNTVGTYDYHCPVHGAMMSGTIYVIPLTPYTSTATPSISPSSTRTVSPSLTATPTNSPLASKTATPTLTVTTTLPPASSLTGTVFEDNETGSVPYSYTYNDGSGASVSFTAVSSAEAFDGSKSYHMVVNTAGSSWGAGFGIGSSYASGTPAVVNATGALYLQFRIKTDKNISFFAFVNDGQVVGLNPNNESWNTPNQALSASSAWQTVTVPISLLTENTGNPNCSPNCLTTGNNQIDLALMSSFGIQFNTLGATSGANVYVDRIEFLKIGGGAPTATPVPDSNIQPSGNGPIVQVLPVPNPGLPKSVSVLLDRHVDKISIKIYTTSMMVADQAQSGPAGPGWASVPVPPAFLAHAATGNYYYIVEVEKNGGVTRKNGVGDLYILR